MYFLKIIILARKNDKMLNVPVISSAPKQCNILIDENILRMKFKCDVGRTNINSDYVGYIKFLTFLAENKINDSVIIQIKEFFNNKSIQYELRHLTNKLILKGKFS